MQFWQNRLSFYIFTLALTFIVLAPLQLHFGRLSLSEVHAREFSQIPTEELLNGLFQEENRATRLSIVAVLLSRDLDPNQVDQLNDFYNQEIQALTEKKGQIVPRDYFQKKRNHAARLAEKMALHGEKWPLRLSDDTIIKAINEGDLSKLSTLMVVAMAELGRVRQNQLARQIFSPQGFEIRSNSSDLSMSDRARMELIDQLGDSHQDPIFADTLIYILKQDSGVRAHEQVGVAQKLRDSQNIPLIEKALQETHRPTQAASDSLFSSQNRLATEALGYLFLAVPEDSRSVIFYLGLAGHIRTRSPLEPPLSMEGVAIFPTIQSSLTDFISRNPEGPVTDLLFKQIQEEIDKNTLGAKTTTQLETLGAISNEPRFINILTQVVEKGAIGERPHHSTGAWGDELNRRQKIMVRTAIDLLVARIDEPGARAALEHVAQKRLFRQYEKFLKKRAQSALDANPISTPSRRRSPIGLPAGGGVRCVDLVGS